MENQDELQEFIAETLRQIDGGVGNYEPSGNVKFEIALTKSVENGGKIGVRVVEVGRKVIKEELSKVSFELRRGVSHPGRNKSGSAVRTF